MTVNGDMSYDPPHHGPPRQERWPNATPREGWPAATGGNGHRRTAGYRSGTDGGYDGSGYGRGGYEGGAAGGYWNGRGYGGTVDGYGGPSDGYGGTWDGGYDEPRGYARPLDAVAGPAGYLDQREYLERVPSGALLSAPEGVGELEWQPRRRRRHHPDRVRGGLVLGALTGLLAAALAVGAASLAAAFIRPQAAPVIAMRDAFFDRAPAAVRNLAVEHLGQNDQTMLLVVMYAVIALLAIVMGCLARRNTAIGVGGIAAFALLGAFVAITAPQSRPTDVIPSVIGGIAGIAAFAWLAYASSLVRDPAPARARRRDW